MRRFKDESGIKWTAEIVGFGDEGSRDTDETLSVSTLLEFTARGGKQRRVVTISAYVTGLEDIGIHQLRAWLHQAEATGGP